MVGGITREIFKKHKKGGIEYITHTKGYIYICVYIDTNPQASFYKSHFLKKIKPQISFYLLCSLKMHVCKFKTKKEVKEKKILLLYCSLDVKKIEFL